MNFIQDLYRGTINAITGMGVTDILDILIVAILIYQLIGWVRSTSTGRVARAIVIILLLTWITSVFQLYVLNFILSNILSLGFIALVIIFHPELRRALDRVGGKNFKDLLNGKTPKGEMEEAILATVSACEIMSREHTGVLLVFERETALDEYFKTGTRIEAKTSEQLLRNLFFPKASLHDGAVIVRGGRIAAAGCVMPLSENPHLNSDLGTRHRAAVGTSEVSDAVVVVVSEETGTISVATNGMLKRHLAPQTLERLLTKELLPDVEEQKPLWTRIRQLTVKKEQQDAK